MDGRQPLPFPSRRHLRLTDGKKGHLVWVPEELDIDESSVGRACVFKHGGTLGSLSEIFAGALASMAPEPVLVEPRVMDRLVKHLAAPWLGVFLAHNSKTGQS